MAQVKVASDWQNLPFVSIDVTRLNHYHCLLTYFHFLGLEIKLQVDDIHELHVDGVKVSEGLKMKCSENCHRGLCNEYGYLC